MNNRFVSLEHQELERGLETETSFAEHNLKQQEYDPMHRLLAQTLVLQRMPEPESSALEARLRRMVRER